MLAANWTTMPWCRPAESSGLRWGGAAHDGLPTLGCLLVAMILRCDGAIMESSSLYMEWHLLANEIYP